MNKNYIFSYDEENGAVDINIVSSYFCNDNLSGLHILFKDEHGNNLASWSYGNNKEARDQDLKNVKKALTDNNKHNNSFDKLERFIEENEKEFQQMLDRVGESLEKFYNR